MTETNHGPGPPVAGDEAETLLGALDRQRSYLEWKCGGLDSAGSTKKIADSAITLGGLLKHMAFVEDQYFTRMFLDRELGPPWSSVDFEADPDWEWRTAADDSPEELLNLWREAVARSRTTVDTALADGQGLDQLASRAWPDGRAPSLRRILVDMVEEYARHVGHADLIRESVDGLVGEDPDD